MRGSNQVGVKQRRGNERSGQGTDRPTDGPAAGQLTAGGSRHSDARRSSILALHAEVARTIACAVGAALTPAETQRLPIGVSRGVNHHNSGRAPASFKRMLGGVHSYSKCNTTSDENGDLAIP